MAPQELLGEGLRSLELRRRAPRPETFQAGLRELVDDAGHERRFGSDDRQVNLLRARERDQAGHVIGGDVDVAYLGFVRGAGIAGSDNDFGDSRGRGALPGQRVLAAASADDQYFHR